MSVACCGQCTETYATGEGVRRRLVSQAESREVMAERVGFEPTIPVKVCPLSRRIVSTTHAPLRAKIRASGRAEACLHYTFCFMASEFLPSGAGSEKNPAATARILPRVRRERLPSDGSVQGDSKPAVRISPRPP